MDNNLTLLENVRKLLSKMNKNQQEQALGILRKVESAEAYSWELCYPDELVDNDVFYSIWDKLSSILK